MPIFSRGDAVEIRNHPAEYWCGDGFVFAPGLASIGVELLNGERMYFENKYVFHRGPKNRSPIRSITRKEIVPGTYGTVSIATSSCGELRYFVEPYETADQLRDVARIFNEIADVLDEQKEA